MEKKVLLYFNTLKPSKDYDSEDIDFTQFIRFRTDVVLTNIVIVPKDVSPFPNTLLAKEKGFTSPSNFTFQVLVHNKCIPKEGSKKTAIHVDSLYSYTFDYEQTSGIQGYQFNAEHKHVTPFLLVRGDFEALTLCLYGYLPETTLAGLQGTNVASKPRVFGEGVGIEGNTESTDDEKYYTGLLDDCQKITFRASKSDDTHDLYERIQKITDEYCTSGTSDPLIDGTLNRLLDGCSYTPQLSQPISLGLSKSVHSSVLNLHSQKAWVELRQQICEIYTFSEERTNLQADHSEQLKTVQQSLHRISQLLEDAVAYAKTNLVNFKEDFEKLMKMIRQSMSITSGMFSLPVFRSCLHLVTTLCSCGDDVSRLVLVHKLIHALFLPLRSPNTCTNIKVQILRAINICVNNPLVAQHILEQNRVNDEQPDSLYRGFILPLRYDSKLPSETLELVEIIIEKVKFFENCAVTRDISLKLSKLKDNNLTTPMPRSVTKEKTFLDLYSQFNKSLSRLTGFFNAARFQRNVKYSLELSCFQYLIYHDVLKTTTDALMAQDLLKTECPKGVLDSLFNFYLVIWQTKQGLEYLSNELEKSYLGRDHLFDIWIEALGHDLNSPHLETNRNEVLFGWLNEGKLCGTPGILDYRQEWISDNDYSHRFADTTDPRTDSGFKVSTSSFMPYSRIRYTLEEFVTILVYQVYAARLVTRLMAHSDPKGKRPVLIGKEDYLQVNFLIKLMHDMCIFNVGKQAVASVISFLGVLPVLISYSSSNPLAKRLVTTVFSYYHLLDIKLSPTDFDRLKITYQQNGEDDAVYYTILKYHKHNDLGVLIDILANTERSDFFKESVMNKIAFCIRILLKHSYTGTDALSILSSQLNIVGATQEDPILVYLLRIIESAIENLGEMNKISSLYPDTLEGESAIVQKMATMSWSDSMEFEASNPQSYLIERTKMKTKWLELSLLTLRLIFSIVYHTGDGLIVSVTLTEPEDMSLDIARDDHLLNECFKQVLKLLYTLDQLDIQNLKPNEHEVMLRRRIADSHALYLLRSNHEVIYRFFDMVNTIVPEPTCCEGSRDEQYQFKCKIPTSLIGNKVVQYLLDGLHDAPQHFLSGIKLLSSLLPPSYIHIQLRHREAFEDSSLKEKELESWVYSDHCLRMYWTNQLLPLKDDIEECLRILMFTSCKEIHISLRSLMVQMVELDIGDLGIARGIFKLLIDQLYEELETYSHVQHTIEYQTSGQPENSTYHPALGNTDSCLWQQSSYEEQFVVSRISRLLCLLLALVRVPSGHFYLLDIFECNIRDGLDQSVRMFFDIIDLFRPNHFVSDLTTELISLLSNHWEQFDRHISSETLDGGALSNKDELYVQSTQLSELISNLLDWIRCNGPTLFPNRALSMLTNISRSVIGTLTILSNPEFCYVIHEIMSQSMKELSLGDQEPFILEKVCQILSLSKLLYDQWTSHVTDNQSNNDIKITLFANLLGPFRTCIELGRVCQANLDSSSMKTCDARLLRQSRELLCWLLEVASSLQQESDSSECRFDEQFDGIEACFLGLERIFQTRKRTLVNFLKSRDLTSLPEEMQDDFEEIFYFPTELRDFKAYALRMFPGYSVRKRVKIYDEDSDDEGDPVIIPFEPHNVSSLTREELHRKNLGGGKAYQSNEFRNTYGVRKANAARLPSVHVDDFLKNPQPEAVAHSTFSLNPNSNLSVVPGPASEGLNSPGRHGQPTFGSSEASPQSSPRGRMNSSNPRTPAGSKPWPTEARQYRPGPGFPDLLPPNAMVGPPLNDFEVNRRGACQRLPNGYPPGPGIPPPYYNSPHYYPSVPSNQGFYERPYFPNGPNQFFDCGQYPRSRLSAPPVHMEFREQMEPRFTKGSSFRPGRTMGRPA